MRTYNIISNLQPHAAITEQYRKLQTAIDYSSFDKDVQVINLTSAYPEEGKTLTVLNLATVYSQAKVKTLIIDLDLRKPKIHRAYQLSNTNGMTEFITGDKPVTDFIHNVGSNLDVMTTGEKVPFPTEILTSSKLNDALIELRKTYKRIIIDCPPLTAVSDATIISKLSDGTAFVVASRKTDKDAAKEVLKQLRDTGANIIGGIMTQINKKDVYYGMNYYYAYKE